MSTIFNEKRTGNGSFSIVVGGLFLIELIFGRYIKEEVGFTTD